MAHVEVRYGDVIKVLGTKYKVEKSPFGGATLNEKHSGGRAHRIRFEHQIIKIDGHHYRVELDFLGQMGLKELKEDELRRLGLPLPPPPSPQEAQKAQKARELHAAFKATLQNYQPKSRDPKATEERLTELDRLLDIGALTPAEHDAKRREIIDSL